MHPSLSPIRQRRRGVALIVVLAFVVLLSGIVVAFFSRATANRQLSNSSSQQAKADELARSALDILVSSLKQEIVNGSSASTTGYTTLYTPTTHAAMVPVCNGTSATPTLLRISTPGQIAAPGVDIAASASLATGTSANGRYVTPARWNRHYLLPRTNAGSTTIDSTPVTSFAPPNWVFVTGTGPASPALSAPKPSVIGRYAYAIYDEGALLDANVAGAPYPNATGTSTLPAEYAAKGAIAFADLTVLGIAGNTGINNLVGWRHYASLPHGGDLKNNFTFSSTALAQYRDLVFSNTSGFLQVSGTSVNGRTDQAFPSRQTLLAFSRATTGEIIKQDALQYLGTFSRAVTAPSAFGSVRLSAGGTLRHYHDDGTWTERAVAAGEPLLQSRFSLGKLTWIASSGTAAARATPIQACFGLQWNAAQSRWDYVGSTGNTLQSAIKTLGEIANEPSPREPNFFELLKAGISASSLGSCPDFQLIQIGANSIDQSDTDHDSTAIYLNCPLPSSTGTDPGQTALGIESVSGSNAQGVSATFFDRPLRSVGELGYVFRDATFQTLDFTSAQSADASLLDLFSAMDEPPVIAGQINPNRATATVLQAILAGATKSGTSSPTFTSDEAKPIAEQQARQLGGSPLCTRADLVPALASLASVRALAPVTNVRTWNLMLDVIAQTGVFPPSAPATQAALNTAFVVRGERRYWLHIAIDRFTGKVVDQQLEPVFE